MQQARQCPLYRSLSTVTSTHASHFRTVDRVQRLKDARSEAAKEIEEYKKQKEAEFKAFEASVRLGALQ